MRRRSHLVKISTRRIQIRTRELASRGALHFLVPIIERAFRNAHQPHGVAIISFADEINVEKFQPPLPFLATQGMAPDAFEIRDVFARPRATRTPQKTLER